MEGNRSKKEWKFSSGAGQKMKSLFLKKKVFWEIDHPNQDWQKQVNSYAKWDLR